MKKFDYEYIQKFFENFDIHDIESFIDISDARNKFQSKYNAHISFSEIYRSYHYSEKVFEICSKNGKVLDRFANFEDIITFIKAAIENPTRDYIIRMPRNKLAHDVILNNNHMRKEFKKSGKIIPEIYWSQHLNYSEIFCKCENFKNNLDHVKQVAYILNDYEDVNFEYTNTLTLMRGNNKYKIAIIQDGLKIYLFDKCISPNDLQMLLTDLRFSGMHDFGNIKIYRSRL
jgi:uncharacterized protein YlbG (UPF0298 family)